MPEHLRHDLGMDAIPLHERGRGVEHREVLGAAWALVALAFLTSASGLVMRNSWWPRVTQGAALASLILCALWWRDASFGIGIDVVLILILAWMHGRPRHLAEGRADAA
jgi:hypothetical protein